MRSRTTQLLAVAAILLVCQIVVNQGLAKVVRDSNGVVSNPAVEAGGHRLPPQPYPGVPYSMIGSIASEGGWIMQCALWPWRQFGSVPWFRHRSFSQDRHLERHAPFVPVP